MNTVFKFISVLALLIVSIAAQAFTYKVDSTTGKLTGISNLDVLGGLYDVEFRTGPFLLDGGSNGSLSPPWIFSGPVTDTETQAALDKSKAVSTAASLALYSAIQSSSALPPGVQSDSTLIQGITDLHPYTILAVPYWVHSRTVWSTFPDLASGQPAVRQTTTDAIDDISHTTNPGFEQTSGNAVYAYFTISKFVFTATPDVIWPPNKKLVPVTVSPTQADLQDCQIISVSSNELITAADYQITEALTVDLRAKRRGNGGGRVYTINVSCSLSGSSVTGNVTVTVPHDQRNKHSWR
jgi:hypothetical protein